MRYTAGRATTHVIYKASGVLVAQFSRVSIIHSTVRSTSLATLLNLTH
jgi:hypothetical protein